MASLCYLIAVFFFLCCLTTSFAQENSTTQGGNKTTLFGRNTEPMNEITNSTACELDITDLEINKVLSKHDNTDTTNIVRITVSVLTTNKTRYCQEVELAWANEVGRTVLTLIRRAKDTIFTSPLFTTILDVGSEKVNIRVKEKIDGCLPSGKRGCELIFDSLLRRLSHNNDKHFFQFCKAHKDDTTRFTTFNCCRIVGDENMAICTDYSSVVVKWTLPAVIAIFCISVLMTVPFLLQYMITYPTTKFYKMSDSPMSLVSIASVILLEGCGPIKSLYRRCLFVGISYLVAFNADFKPERGWEFGLFVAWGVIFLLVHDIQVTYEEGKKECIEKRKLKHKCDRTKECSECIQKCKQECADPELHKYLISCFTLPFCLFFSLYKKLDDLLKDKSRNGYDRFEENTKFNDFMSSPLSLKGLMHALLLMIFFLIYALLLILLFFICCPCVLAFCLLKFFCINFLLFFILSHHDCFKSWLKYLFIAILRFVTFLIIIFLSGMISISVLSFVAGLILNAEFFNPFIVLILAVAAYFLKSWRWSVEAKCLHVKTLIIEISIDEVAKDKISPQNNVQEGASANEDQLTCKDHFLDFLCSGPSCWRKLFSCTTSTVRAWDEDGNEKKNIIKFDQHGEAMISKELYKTICSKKSVLDLDHLLFYFFRRAVFVCLYSVCLLTVMILARHSRVSDTLQFISSILGILLPFVFDSIFAEHESQSTSEEAAMRQKLKHILKVKKQENNTILVELKDPLEAAQTAEEPKDQSGTGKTPPLTPEKLDDQSGTDLGISVIVSSAENPNDQSGTAETQT